MGDREPRWDIDRAIGAEAELWVSNIRNALQTQSVEVKRDLRALKTGNLYVEYECIGKPSGIAATHSDIWMFVLEQDALAVVISTERLKEMCRKAYLDPRNRREEKDGSHPTKGVLLSLWDMLHRE